MKPLRRVDGDFNPDDTLENHPNIIRARPFYRVAPGDVRKRKRRRDPSQQGAALAAHAAFSRRLWRRPAGRQRAQTPLPDPNTRILITAIYFPAGWK